MSSTDRPTRPDLTLIDGLLEFSKLSTDGIVAYMDALETRITELEAERELWKSACWRWWRRARANRRERSQLWHASFDMTLLDAKAKDRITELEAEVYRIAGIEDTEYDRIRELEAEVAKAQSRDIVLHRWLRAKQLRINELEGTLREIVWAWHNGEFWPTQAVFDRWNAAHILRDKLFAGEQVGTELHSTSMQDGQMVNGEQTKCRAVIWHGPGHQSKTRCQVQGPHTVHRAIYGRFDDEAEWEGDETFSSRIW